MQLKCGARRCPATITWPRNVVLFLQELSAIQYYSAAQIYPNYAYAFYTRVFCVYTYVNTRLCLRIYARVWLFVKHFHKFPYLKHCLCKQRTFMGIKKLAKFAYG